MFLSSNFYIWDRNIEHNLWYVDNQDIFLCIIIKFFFAARS